MCVLIHLDVIDIMKNKEKIKTERVNKFISMNIYECVGVCMRKREGKRREKPSFIKCCITMVIYKLFSYY